MRINRTVGLVTAVLVAGCWLAGPIPAAAQGQAIVTVDYMKVAPGQDDAICRSSRRCGSRSRGEGEGRQRARVVLVQSQLAERDAGRSANYVAMAIYSSSKRRRTRPERAASRDRPAQSAAEFMKKTLASHDLVRSELWRTITTAPKGPLAQARPLPERPVREGADRRRCGLSRDREVWKRIHDVRIRRGRSPTGAC